MLCKLITLLVVITGAASEGPEDWQYLIHTDPEKAITGLSELPELEEDAELLFLLGSAHNNLWQYERAAGRLERAVELEPGHLPARVQLGRTYRSLGRINDAHQAFNEVIEREPEHYEAIVFLADLSLQLSRLKKAGSLYDRLIQQDEGNSRYHQKRAEVYQAKDSLAQAVESYETAHMLNPSGLTIMYELARLYYKLGEVGEAFEIINLAVDTYDESPRLWREQGRIQYAMGKRKQAAHSYKQAIELGHDHAATWRNKGMAYLFSDQLERALQALDTSLSMDNEDPQTAFYLAMALFDLEHYEAARAHFEHALDLQYDQLLLETQTQIAVVLTDLNLMDSAISIYQRTIDMWPDEHELVFHLARVYDEYYEDKSVPLSYYQDFLDSESGLTQMESYAEQRIRMLRREIHMEDGRADDS